MINWKKVEEKLKTVSIIELFKIIDEIERNEILEKSRILEGTLRILEKLAGKIDEFKLSNSEKSFLILTFLLFVIEGSLTHQINIIIYALNKTGHHDIWSEFKHKVVDSYDEVANINLNTRDYNF